MITLDGASQCVEHATNLCKELGDWGVPLLMVGYGALKVYERWASIKRSATVVKKVEAVVAGHVEGLTAKVEKLSNPPPATAVASLSIPPDLLRPQKAPTDSADVVSAPRDGEEKP